MEKYLGEKNILLFKPPAIGWRWYSLRKWKIVNKNNIEWLHTLMYHFSISIVHWAISSLHIGSLIKTPALTDCLYFIFDQRSIRAVRLQQRLCNISTVRFLQTEIMQYYPVNLNWLLQISDLLQARPRDGPAGRREEAEHWQGRNRGHSPSLWSELNIWVFYLRPFFIFWRKKL